MPPNVASASSHFGVWVAATFAAGALILADPATAQFQTGIDGTAQYTSEDPAERDLWLDRTNDLSAGTVRITVDWNTIASAEPADPASPSDPAYDFSLLDAAVTGAAERGLRVMLTFLDAPAYARDGHPNDLDGSWKPRPRALGAFARAVATRYPTVRHFDVWNEPNLELYLAPQYSRGRQVAVTRYRRMVNAVARAVHAVASHNRVVVGSLAPYGDPPGGDRTRPLTFLRKLFCLTGRLEPVGCPNKTQVDVLGHHPINQSGPPRQSAISPNDASSPDLRRVRSVLRAAERNRTIAGKRERHPIWATEFWWTSSRNSPTEISPGLKRHARYIQESMFLFWKAGAKVAIYLRLTDTPEFPAGLFHGNGTPKPAAQAFAFPFVSERTPQGGLRAWGKSPLAGRLHIERRGDAGWRTVKAFGVSAGEVFDTKLPFSGPARLRGRVGEQRSLTWNQR